MGKLRKRIVRKPVADLSRNATILSTQTKSRFDPHLSPITPNIAWCNLPAVHEIYLQAGLVKHTYAGFNGYLKQECLK